MTQNIGTADRVIRVLIGVALLQAAVLLEHPTRWFALIGLLPLLTGIFGTCPLYALLGISTYPKPKPKM